MNCLESVILRAAVIVHAICLTLLYPSPPYAAVIEVPPSNATTTGISVLSGWKCVGGALTVRFDGGDPMDVPYGSERNDTISVCGDADNGYALLFNYNLLAAGQHEAVVYDDGLEFARVTFTVVTSGAEFLTGAAGTCNIALGNGQQMGVEWSESQQAPVATAFSSAPSVSGMCTRKTATVLDSGTSGNPATWTVTNPCNEIHLLIDLTPTTSDGFFACNHNLDFVQNGVVYAGSTDVSWFDRGINFQLCNSTLSAFVTLETKVITSIFTTALDFTQPFTMFYFGVPIFEFP